MGMYYIYMYTIKSFTPFLHVTECSLKYIHTHTNTHRIGDRSSGSKEGK